MSPLAAVYRARFEIASVALTYAISLAVGVAMASGHNSFAVERRDAIVKAAQSSSSLVADRHGNHLQAALLDFGSNLVLGGVTSTLIGLSVAGEYPIVAYRGWVGGIVVIDRKHASRLSNARQALYYWVTIVLQLIPYSIAGGVGVRAGIAAWKNIGRPGQWWLGLPKQELSDALAAYLVIAPLFLVASLWEFLFQP